MLFRSCSASQPERILPLPESVPLQRPRARFRTVFRDTGLKKPCAIESIGRYVVLNSPATNAASVDFPTAGSPEKIKRIALFIEDIKFGILHYR